MKQLANRYFYEIHYRYDENGKYHSWAGELYADRERRSYKTKMKPSDLPEHYCKVQRYGSHYDIINAKGVVDIAYDWCKFNHFMKDSVLRISYSGKIKSYHEKYLRDSKEVTSMFTSYTNVDEMVFAYSIFKFLAYCKKYSKMNINKVRKAFIEHCEWLKAHEPAHAPHDGYNQNGSRIFPDFGEWFDKKINEYIFE